MSILDQITGNDGDLREMIEEETFNARVAQAVYDARQSVGLTQTELAQRIGSTQSVIARLEDADYTGHSLGILNRIAMATGFKLDVRFIADVGL